MSANSNNTGSGPANSSAVNSEHIISDLNSILKECDELLEHHAAEILIMRTQCIKLLDGLKSVTELNEKEATNVVQQYAKVVLDVTYIKENQLVEEEFPEHDGYQRMQRILETLKQPELLVHKVFGSRACAIAILDKEMVECLCWRRGALCYMYCHTVWENQERVKKTGLELVKCLEGGVRELQAMLAVRTPVSSGSDVVTNSRDTAKLLSQGMFSDTHVLALMYGGEMCFWHQQLTNQSNVSKPSTTNQSGASSKDQTNSSLSCEGSTTKSSTNSQSKSNTASCATQTSDSEKTFDSQQLGKQFLQQFIEVVKGPLRSAGWDCSKAEELLQVLGK